MLKGAALEGETGYRICTRCIMDTTDPDIQFDEDGVCSNCRRFEEQLRVRLVAPDDRERVLSQLVDKIRKEGSGKDYDCLLGVSGGTDSTYLALMAKRLGLRPLAVHFDNGWNSEQAVGNIERTLKKLGIDLFTHVVDWEEYRDLQLSFLRASTPDAEIPTDHGIISLLYSVAAKHRIRYILDGTNFAAEGLGPQTAWAYGHLDWRYIRGIHRRFGSAPLKTYPHMGLPKLASHIFLRRIAFVSLLNYMAFRKEDAVAQLEGELAWENYGGKHCESIYTRFFQSYILPRKFHIDKRRCHLSSLLVSSGEISREEALNQVRKPPFPPETLREDREYVVKKLCIDEEEFERIMALPIRSFHDYKNSYAFYLAKNRFLAWTRRSGLSHK